MGNETTITPEQAIQLRENCKERIAIRDALHRLELNADFKKVVEDYTEHEPVRLVHLLAEPTFNLGGKKELHRDEIKESLIGIARFSEYLRNIYRLASQAEKTLEDLRQAESDAHTNDITEITE